MMGPGVSEGILSAEHESKNCISGIFEIFVEIITNVLLSEIDN